MIELTGEYDFAAPQELVWEMLLNPVVLASTIPGCEKLEPIDENTFQGRLNIKVGPVQGVFQGKVESSDLRPPTGFHIVVNGNGPAGVVRGEGDLTLESIQSMTRLRYNGSAQVSGRIASVGQRVMDSSAKSIVRQSLQNLDQQIQARLHPAVAVVSSSVTEASPATAPLPAAPGQAEFTYNLVKDVVADLIPDPRQRQALLGLALVVTVVGLVNAFANLVARRVVKRLEAK